MSVCHAMMFAGWDQDFVCHAALCVALRTPCAAPCTVPCAMPGATLCVSPCVMSCVMLLPVRLILASALAAFSLFS